MNWRDAMAFHENMREAGYAVHSARMFAKEGRPDAAMNCLNIARTKRSIAKGYLRLYRHKPGADLIAAVIGNDKYYRATVRLTCADWADVFVSDKFGGGIGHVMVVANPNAPHGLVWSAYGSYANNIRTILNAGSLRESESETWRAARKAAS